MVLTPLKYRITTFDYFLMVYKDEVWMGLRLIKVTNYSF